MTLFKARIPLFVCLALSLSLCAGLSSCTPSDDNGGTTPTAQETINLSRVTDLPTTGGVVSSIDVLDDQTLVEIIDGNLATVSLSSAGTQVQATNGAPFVAVKVGASKELYLLANDALWVKSDINSAAQKCSVFTRNSQTLEVHLDLSPQGYPLLRVMSYPTSMQVWTSTDKGATWIKVSVPTGSEYGGGIAYGSNNEVYASSPNSFYSSVDAGANWTKHAAVKSGYGGELLVRRNGDVLYYIPNGGGLWSSSDKGASFTQLTPFNAHYFYSTIQEGSDGFLYALVKTSSSPSPEGAGELMKSQDGKTWTHVLFVEGSALVLKNSLIATGSASEVCGGCFYSADKGQTFRASGIRSLKAISHIGWNATKDLCVLADNGVFVKTSSGWSSYGNSVVFRALTSSGDSKLFVVGLRTSYLTSNSGQSWKTLPMPALSGAVGSGTYQVPVCCGLNLQDALVSITYYRYDLSKHTNGMLIRLGSNASVSTIPTPGLNFSWMVQGPANLIYARTDNFVTNQQSTTYGNTWTEVSSLAPGFVYTQSGKYIAYGSGSTFLWGQAGNTNTAPMNLKGLDVGSYIVSSKFDADNRLYVVTSDAGLYVAASPWN